MNAGAAKFSNIRTYPKGAVIAREQDAESKELYLLLQGSVGVYKDYRLNTEAMITVLSQGGFYGEMSLFLGRAPEHTLIALSDVISLVVNRKNLAEFLSRQPDMAASIIEGICRKLDSAEEKIARDLPANADRAEGFRKSALFPEGHGSYQLQMNNTNDEFLFEQPLTCPLCGHSFTHMTVLQSRLRIEKTDMDLRTTYRGIEPMYYDLVTCPNCFASAMLDQFNQLSRRWMEEINKKVAPYKLEMYVRTGVERDTFTVFAGYYLAIKCAFCFDNYQLITGNLWLRLSRIYGDCGDTALQRYAWEKSLEEYMYAYEHFALPERQMQQLCYIMGNLHLHLGDLDAARTCYFNAKASRGGTTAMSRQADMRLDEIREIKQGKQA